MKKYEIITIGDSTEDIFVSSGGIKVRRDGSFKSGVSATFEVGDKILLDEMSYEVGGSACNVAVGLSRLGIAPSIATVVGEDTPAERIISRLQENNVDTENVLVEGKVQTSFSVIFRFEEGRTIFIYHGLKNYGKLRLKKGIRPAWIFLAPTGEGSEPVENDVIRFVSEKGAHLAWNPGALQVAKGADHYRHLLKNTEILFMNKEEAIKFIAHPVRPDARTLLQRLHLFGPKIIVITEGKAGAHAFDGKKLYHIGALEETKRVDATGAGDSFTTGFLARIMASSDEITIVSEEIIGEALRWGIVNSNSVITFVGAQAGLLDKEGIDQGLKSLGRVPFDVE